MNTAGIPGKHRNVKAQFTKDKSLRFSLQGEWLPPVLAILLLLVIFRRVLAGKVIATGDLATYFYPYWVAVSHSIRSGQLPMWNPYLFNGVPLLANSQIGVFYPINWPFWLLSGGTLNGVATALHSSVLLHVILSLLSMYFLARKMKLSPWGAAVTGFIYAGSGFIGIHVEHLNQLQALAWMPFVLLPARGRESRISLPQPLSLVAMAMILLSGHTQMAFITMFALLLWRTGYLFISHLSALKKITAHLTHTRRILYKLLSVLKGWGLYFFPFLIGGMIASVQVAPTLELLNLSARQNGLDWREAVSFSLHPLKLAGTFLPPYISSPNYPESVAYIGGFGLCLLVYGVWGIYRKRQVQYFPVVFLAIAGVILALGGYNPVYLFAVRIGLPGLKHFRAPVRFLALYILSGGLLTGLGVDYLHKQVSSANEKLGNTALNILGIIALICLGVDLIVCSDWLPHGDATISRAYTDMRPATAHLISVTNAYEQQGDIPGRFLSISQMLFEIGDKAEIESIYSTVLSKDALWSYFVSEKQREVLAPNLPLAFRVYSADGYDGGLLPLAPYITFTHLLIEDGTQDGRLRENLTQIPDRRWLQLMDVRYIITDKVSDIWLDGILYDRQFTPVLLQGDELSIAWLPGTYKSDGIGLIYKGDGGQVSIEFEDGSRKQYPLPEMSIDNPYRLRWENSASVTSVALSTNASEVTYKGISLINEVTGSFYPLTLSSNYKLVHSGDVKIYEDIKPVNHAFFVPECRISTTDSHALIMMAHESFDPLSRVILDGSGSVVCGHNSSSTDSGVDAKTASVSIVDYKETELVLDITTHEPGFVVVSDGWYPGWQARLTNKESSDESQSVPVLRGNLMFRAIPVPAGQWSLELEYLSRYFLTGLVITGIGIVLLYFYSKYLKSTN